MNSPLARLRESVYTGSAVTVAEAARLLISGLAQRMRQVLEAGEWDAAEAFADHLDSLSTALAVAVADTPLPPKAPPPAALTGLDFATLGDGRVMPAAPGFRDCDRA